MKRRENKPVKILVLVFMGFTLIGMTFSFIFFGFSGENTARYKNFKFKLNSNGIWIAEINGKHISFNFLPNEVGLNTSADLTALKNKFEIDVTYSINDSNKQIIALAEHQIALALQNYNIYIRQGLLQDISALPVINCSIATSTIPVIYFKTGNSTKITQENNCIVAEGKNEVEFIKMKDRILYAILGVME